MGKLGVNYQSITGGGEVVKIVFESEDYVYTDYHRRIPKTSLLALHPTPLEIKLMENLNTQHRIERGRLFAQQDAESLSLKEAIRDADKGET